jgi:hypothetical protein
LLCDDGFLKNTFVAATSEAGTGHLCFEIVAVPVLVLKV